MDKCFVYVLADDTGIRYIGVSIDPLKRVKYHAYEASNKNNKSYNLRKSRWIRSVDFNFRHRVVFSGTEVDCYRKEIELISLARRKNINLVNTSSGGDRPPRINELPNYDETIRKIKNKATGRKASSDTRLKMSKAKKGINPEWVGDMSGNNNPRSRPVAQLNEHGDITFIWSCAIEAVNALGLGKTSVTSVCRGNQKTAGGYRFMYF